MAEVREVREVPVVRRRRGAGLAAFGMFLIGGFMIGIVAVVMLNVHWTMSWPAGRVDLGATPPQTTAFNATPYPAPAAAPPTTNTAATPEPAAPPPIAAAPTPSDSDTANTEATTNTPPATEDQN
ncbi:MAG TPA: hypothetical protein VNH44_15020 [Micropepsaceae bacterium]|nr:hypothetical protein [Micropepsaceae bacterium]